MREKKLTCISAFEVLDKNGVLSDPDICFEDVALPTANTLYVLVMKT
jgi:hypothetical protein